MSIKSDLREEAERRRREMEDAESAGKPFHAGSDEELRRDQERWAIDHGGCGHDAGLIRPFHAGSEEEFFEDRVNRLRRNAYGDRCDNFPANKDPLNSGEPQRKSGVKKEKD